MTDEGGARFERRVRLVHKAEFDALFQRAERSSDRFFTVLARPNTRPHPRLGLAISKRSAKSAVVRNTLKRVIRESFRHRLGLLSGLDIVVISRPGLVPPVVNRDVFESLERHWLRVVKRCARC